MFYVVKKIMITKIEKYFNIFIIIEIILVSSLIVIFFNIQNGYTLKQAICPYEHLNEGEGYYFPDSGRIECCFPRDCLHEVTHKFDYEENNKFSTTEEWAEIVEYYKDNIMSEIPYDELTMTQLIIYHMPNIKGNECEGCWGGYADLYAEILAETHGEERYMLEYFKPYYNWDRLMELFEPYI